MTGASGQDGHYLLRSLLREGVDVYAFVRPSAAPRDFAKDLASTSRLVVVEIDILDVEHVTQAIASVQPREMYNLAGQSSVSASFEDPQETWRTNADAVAIALEAIRTRSPETRFYQASSTDMFGATSGHAVLHDEMSPLNPQSPYAAAKAAAHILCGAYRRTYGMRIACGILANHESRRRPANFLTRKVVDHVRRLHGMSLPEIRDAAPLRVGNLAAQRDWGFAPDYVDGIVRVARQIDIRATHLHRAPEPDGGSNYVDYVLGSGRLHAVWELVDAAFELADIHLEWDRTSPDPADWNAVHKGTAITAVAVDDRLYRPADPYAIAANSTKARHELGWDPQPGLERFLRDMLEF